MKEQGTISFSSAILMNINVIVGVGIYFLPQIMAQKAGNISFMGWVAAGSLLFPIVWTVALAARLFPGMGGFYNYCSQGLKSPRLGFIASWAYLLGFLATAAAQLMFFKQLLTSSFSLPTSYQAGLAINFFIVIVLSLLNLLDVNIISRIQSFATILKLTPLLLVILLVPFYWKNMGSICFADVASIGSTVPLAIFGYWGFESCASTSHLIKGGSQKASGVILSAFFISMVLYALFNFGVLAIMGTKNVAQFGCTVFPTYLGITSAPLLHMLKAGISFALMLALFNAAYGVMLANVSNALSLSSKGYLPYSSALNGLNKFGRPVTIVLLQAIIVFSLMSFIPFEQILVALSNLGLITTIILTLAAVANIITSQEGKIANKLLVYSGFVSCAVLIYYTWLQIGATQSERFLYALPVAIGLLGGLAMFNYRKKKVTTWQ